MTTRGTLGAMLLLLAISHPTAPLQAQQPPSDQRPAFRSGVELVTVEVAVLDKNGTPIHGLKPGDFTVTVDGEPRRVVTADFIDTSATLDARTSTDVVPVSTNEGTGVGRLIVFVVDGSTLDPGEMRRIAGDASRLLARLTFSDRSALVPLPVGRSIAFTWAHDRVREALLRVSTTGGMNSTAWEYGSLSEARDIATRGSFALREVASRECSTLSASRGGFGGGPAPSPGPAPGQSPAPGETPQGGSGSGSSGGSSGAPPAGNGGFFGDPADDRCLREIQSQAEMAWNSARATSLSSLTALRNVLATLAQVQGDKTVVLISGGWPLDEHDETSLITTVAADAAAARAKLFTVFVPPVTTTASLRRVNTTSRGDQHLYVWPLETLAGMTGGRPFRADAGAAGIFDRLARELSGFYRIGVEKNASDTGATGRPMKVKVAREGTTVRARNVFDAATYEDRDWAARLASALQSPAPATALGLRVTSYLAADPDDAGSIRLLFAGDVSRLQPGEATLQLVVRDLDGQRVVAGEHRLGDMPAGTAPFATNVRVPPGTYVVRLAIQDGAGRVGSVDHRVDARAVPMGGLRAVGPMLAATGHDNPRLALDGIRPDERLAFEVDLQGAAVELENADVTFEVAASAQGPALVVSPASLSDGSHGRTLVAQAVADVRVLPPGQYIARAKVRSGGDELGELRRAFVILERGDPAVVSTAGSTAVVATSPLTSATIVGRAASVLPRFAASNVLAPDVLGAYLDRVGSRPDAAHPAVSELLSQARASGIAELQISDAQAAQTPVAAFLKGLTLLAQKKYNPAAAAFRAAMRASPDFYPAMVYLGACYAAAGNDKEASAIWRTALIREGSSPTVHLLLADALLRQGNGNLALQVVSAARTRWPDDDRFTQKFVLASLLAGDTAGALQTLDDLVTRGVSDEPMHALALLVLYDSITHGRTIESAEADRARMLHLADAYRARGGPSIALVDAWVEAVKKLK